MPTKVPAASRTVALLSNLAKASAPVTAVQLSRQIGAPRSSTYQLLQVLEAEGFVIHYPETSRWGLGLAAFELGTAYLNVLTASELEAITDPVSREYCVISAYNTGPGNVLRTFGGSSKNRDGALARINGLSAHAVYDTLRRQLPYAETRQYLQKVVGFRKEFIALN